MLDKSCKAFICHILYECVNDRQTTKIIAKYWIDGMLGSYVYNEMKYSFKSTQCTQGEIDIISLKNAVRVQLLTTQTSCDCSKIGKNRKGRTLCQMGAFLSF